MMGIGLSRLLGWKADLKNPKLEVNLVFKRFFAHLLCVLN